MKRYKLTIEYDGSHFCGWQTQKSSCNLQTIRKPSIQSCIEKALYDFSGQQIKVFGSGRTDSGVHALGQVAHIDLDSNLPEIKIMLGINFHLKSYPIAITNVESVTKDFHARFSALRKHYKYRIINRPSPLVLEKNLAWQVFKKVDYNKLSLSLQELIGNHNFNSFRSSMCEAKNPNRTIEDITINKNEDLIEICFVSKSFLHNQIRIMVGTIIEIATGKNYEIKDIIAKENRIHAGLTAPAYGLYLIKVEYN